MPDKPESDPLADFSQHPNDAYFKAVFSQPEHAAAFFQSHLPPGITTTVDWKSLTLLPSNFVKQDLQQAHSDLLFSVNAGSGQLLLYLLFEHQTTVDNRMPLRLLAYMVNIWLAHEQQSGLPLPVILPFVLHQGPKTWSVSRQFEDLVAIPPELAGALLPFVPKFIHALLDLTQCDPAKEEHEMQLKVVLQLMKLARLKKLLEFFQWLSSLPGEMIPDPLLRLSLTYALHGDDHLDVKKIYHTLETNRSLQEKTMSIANQLKAEGRAEGKAEGKAEGRAEGKAEGKAEGRAEGKAEGIVEGMSHGKWVGKLQLLQELMEVPISPSESLAALSLEELQARFDLLQAEYASQFKGR